MCQPVFVNITKLGDPKLQLGIIKDDLDFKGPVGEAGNSFLYENDEAEVTITEHNGDIYGHAWLDNGKSYDIEYCGDNIHVVKQMDVENMPEAKHLINDVVGNASSRIEYPEMRMDDTTTIVTFSLKFYYTPQFAAETADIDGFIEEVIAVTNQGYINSKAPVRVQSCGSEKAPFDETMKGGDDLDQLRDMKGSLEEVRGTADAATILVSRSDVCGLGSIDSIRNGNTLTLNLKSCLLSFYVLGHELGHNFGLLHNKEDAPNPTYADGLGYLLPGGKHRTIMSYTSEFKEQRINYYSNPDVIYPKTGQPTGVLGSANNVRILTLNRFAMAALGDESKCAPITTTTTTTTTPAPTTTESYSFCVKKGITTDDDLKWRGYKDITNCIFTCYDDSYCLGWVHNKRYNYCYSRLMKTTQGEWDGPDLTNLYCALERNCYSAGVFAYYWNWMDNAWASSADECHRTCRATHNCGNWRYKDNICKLFNVHVEKSSSWDSGSRRC